MWILDSEIVLWINDSLHVRNWAEVDPLSLNVKLDTLLATEMVLFGETCRFSYA